jgi:hypothetical protein
MERCKDDPSFIAEIEGNFDEAGNFVVMARRLANAHWRTVPVPDASNEGANGEPRMHIKKIKAPHAKDAPRDVNGKPDWSVVKAAMTAMTDQIDAGHYSFDDGGQVDSANGSHDDEKALMKALRGMRTNQRLLWFVRGETDPTA